jgi:hypothetical protein
VDAASLAVAVGHCGRRRAAAAAAAAASLGDHLILALRAARGEMLGLAFAGGIVLRILLEVFFSFSSIFVFTLLYFVSLRMAFMAFQS